MLTAGGENKTQCWNGNYICSHIQYITKPSTVNIKICSFGSCIIPNVRVIINLYCVTFVELKQEKERGKPTNVHVLYLTTCQVSLQLSTQ